MRNPWLPPVGPQQPQMGCDRLEPSCWVAQLTFDETTPAASIPIVVVDCPRIWQSHDQTAGARLAARDMGQLWTNYFQQIFFVLFGNGFGMYRGQGFSKIKSTIAIIEKGIKPEEIADSPLQDEVTGGTLALQK